MSNSEQKTNEGKAGIVLNRMYAGDYLSTNLGHEVINMFATDKGEHYLYLNPYGSFDRKHYGKIGYMLLVKYHSKDVFEVLGKAEGLEEVMGKEVLYKKDYKMVNYDIFKAQKNYIEGNKIIYGEKSLIELFSDAEQQNIFVTYKARTVYRRKEETKIFICFNKTGNIPTEEDKETKIYLSNLNQAKQSLKQYIYPNNEDDYHQLMKLIIDEKGCWWEKEPVKSVKEEIKKENEKQIHREVSIFDICGIQNNENLFSNALKYFMEQYPQLWQILFKRYNINLNDKFSVMREEDATIDDKDWEQNNGCGGGRIDLLIRDEKNIIVIENKIKSDINTKKSDITPKKPNVEELNANVNESNTHATMANITQLDRYVNYTKWLTTQGGTGKTKKLDIGKNRFYFILAPNYNVPENTMNGLYKVITYRELYKFLDSRTEVKEDINFKAFINAMQRHTNDNENDYLYYDMLEKFARRIKEAENEK